MRQITLALLLFSLVAVLVGCGSDRRASVSGKVTVSGKGPLPGGSIQFISASEPNRFGGGLIRPDGTYEVLDAPVGPCKVVIDNSHLDPNRTKASGLPGMPGPGMKPPGPGIPGPGMPPPGIGQPPKEVLTKAGGIPKGVDIPSEMGVKSETSGQKYVRIDPAYTAVETTPLTFEVQPGSNSGNFDIK